MFAGTDYYFPWNSAADELSAWLRDVWIDQMRHPEDRVFLKPRGNGYYDWSIGAPVA